MKRIFLPWGVSVLLALLVPCAMAQLGPVRLTVTRIQTPDTHRFTEGSYQYVDEYDDSVWVTTSDRVLQVGDFVHYHINLALMSPKPLPAVRTEWAILFQPANEQEPRVIRGKSMGELDLSKRLTKLECDTQMIHVRTKAQADQRNAILARPGWSESSQTPDNMGLSAYSGIATEILGYSVEVFDGDEVVASDIQPPDTKRKIELLKDDKKGG